MHSTIERSHRSQIRELSVQEIEAVQGGGVLGLLIKVGKEVAKNPQVRKVLAVTGIISDADLRSDTPGGAK